MESRKISLSLVVCEVGPCSFWFRASSYECLLGVDLGVNLGVDRDVMNKKT